MNKGFIDVALCQGTTLVVPQEPKSSAGLSSCRRRACSHRNPEKHTSGAKARRSFFRACGTTEVVSRHQATRHYFMKLLFMYRALASVRSAARSAVKGIEDNR